jgi:hypothetical protein
MTSHKSLKLALVAVALLLQAGAAQAITITRLASNVYANIYGIAVDSTGVYVTGSTTAIRDFNGFPASGVIGVVKLTGGAVKTLYNSSNYPSQSGHVAPLGITTNGAGMLYWADPDAGPSTGASFIEGTGTGATATQFFGVCCGPGVLPGDGIGVSLVSNTLYFSDGTGGRVGSFASTSSAPVQIGPTVYTPDFNTETYALTAVANGKIFLAQSGQQIAGDGSGHQIILDRSPTVTSAILYISTSGGPVFKTLTTAIPNPQGIAAAGNVLYVTTAHTIWEVSQANGHILGSLTNSRFVDLHGAAVYGNALYVADGQNTYGAFVNGTATVTQDLPGVIWKITP